VYEPKLFRESKIFLNAAVTYRCQYFGQFGKKRKTQTHVPIATLRNVHACDKNRAICDHCDFEVDLLREERPRYE